MKFLSLLVNVAQWSPMNARLQGASAENLLEEGISYKKQRYKNFTNKLHNSRAKASITRSFGVTENPRDAPYYVEFSLRTRKVAHSGGNVYIFPLVNFNWVSW